jgi:hypothetical protein
MDDEIPKICYNGDLTVKKTRAQFLLLVMIALIVIPGAASSQNTTNSTTVQTLTETNLTTATTYQVNATTTVIPANATPEPLTTNITVSGTTTVAVVPTGTSVAPLSTGNLTVASSPLGAGILLDGVLYGNTPQNVTGISAGNHIIRLTLSGYYDYEGTIYVVPGQVTDVFGTLPPLSVSSSSSSTGSATLTTTIVPASAATVQPTATSSGGLLDSPTIVAALIGIVTASIGAFAAIFPHISKAKK